MNMCIVWYAWCLGSYCEFCLLHCNDVRLCSKVVCKKDVLSYGIHTIASTFVLVYYTFVTSLGLTQPQPG